MNGVVERPKTRRTIRVATQGASLGSRIKEVPFDEEVGMTVEELFAAAGMATSKTSTVTADGRSVGLKDEVPRHAIEVVGTDNVKLG